MGDIVGFFPFSGDRSSGERETYMGCDNLDVHREDIPSLVQRELKVESFGWPLLESFDLFGEEILQMFHGGHLGHFEHIRRFGPFWKLEYFRTHLV